MKKKVLKKAIAMMLVITLTFANFIFLATYAINENYEDQDKNINKTDVSFDAYFVSEEGIKTHQKVTEMNNSELKLFLSVSVTTGYLRDAVVAIRNANFRLVKGEELPNGVEAIDEENNTVTLNQINKGETKEIELQIEVIKDEKFDLSNFSKDAEVKLTGTFINNSGKAIEAEKTIIVNLALSENAESEISARVIKYAMFEENGENKAFLQIGISSKVKNNLLPIKYTLINLQAPNLFGIDPESVSVTSSSTKATNGDDGTAFNEENYIYKDDTITIGTINNADENNKVSWVKDAVDEYLVNLIYPLKDMKNSITEVEENKIQLTVDSKLSLYNNEEKEIQTQISGELQLPEASDSIVSYSINNMEKEIAKGYMLVENADNTYYKQEIKMNIGYKPAVNNIEIDQNNEYYTDEQGNTYIATTYYKQISVNRENLVKILGEDGTVTIIANGITVATLDKDTTSYTFEDEISNIMISTSNPIQNGVLTIENEKYIKSNEYNKTIISNINKLTTSITGREALVEEKVSTEIDLVQPTLQIKSSIKNSKLSTVIENKNVEMRVTLQTNNPTNRLFKNPTIELELPSYIEKVDVKTINILYNDELQEATGDIITNKEGNKVIIINLVGEQTKFNNVLSVEGTTLIIEANITVDKTAPSITQKMNVKVTNNNEEIVETSSNISYMAPTGIITLNSISGYSDEKEEITSMSGEEETGKIDVAGKSRIATETITIINNYDYTCGDIAILGRTPTEGNKSPLTQKDLGSTFTAKMASNIKAVEGVENNNITVYYSENENATKDLNNNSNNWTTNLSSLDNVKSYLVTINPTMKKGDKIELNYDIEIPEGLSREESTYGIYQVSYTNLDGTLSGATETIQSPIVGLSTGTGPELQVELTADVENGEEVREGQVIEYTIKVTNIGTAETNDIAVEADIPNGSYYTTYELDGTQYVYETDPTVKKYTKTIENLGVGESKEEKFLLTVGNRVEYTVDDFIIRSDFDSDEAYQQARDEFEMDETIKNLNSTTVEVVAKATADDEGKPVVFTSNTMLNEKVKGYFNLRVKQQEIGTIEAGQPIEYILYIDKYGEENPKNVQITCAIPDGLTYSSTRKSDEAINESIDGKTITWNIDELTENETIVLTCKIDEINEDKVISVKIQGTCNEYDGTIESNTQELIVGTPKLEISHSSNNTVGYMTEEDEIVYTIVVKNNSMATAYEVDITDYLSDGISLKSLKYTIGDETKSYTVTGSRANFTRNMPGNSTLIIELTATADMLSDEENERTVSNRFEVTAKNASTISSSVIEHKVNKKQYTVDDNDKVIEKSSISGLAWLDKNSNGIRDLGEELIPQIPVILINEAGKTVASSITDEQGAYMFSNIPVGDYIVAFLYDVANYDVTAYGIGESTKNNDAVTMNVYIEDILTACAATNVINLKANLYNIDLGLVENPKFDLSLTKTLSKVTIQTSAGTTTRDYNDSTLEKVEIQSKYLEGAVVAVEYAIKVTNNGAIPGYASRIVDYLSNTDLKFNSETNVDWYLGTDGNIYNSSLANTLLQPGETATLKLVLTKQITERNTGLTNNTAEIYEAYNDAGLEDYNSTPGNKAQNENDLGQADIIIGPKTGAVLYIGYTIVLLSIMIVAIYVINKKVIKRM